MVVNAHAPIVYVHKIKTIHHPLLNIVRSTKSVVQIGHLTLPEEVGDLVSAAALEPSLTLVVVSSILLLLLGLCVGAVVATGTLVGLRVLHLPILRCLGSERSRIGKTTR